MQDVFVLQLTDPYTTPFLPMLSIAGGDESSSISEPEQGPCFVALISLNRVPPAMWPFLVSHADVDD